MANDDDSLKSDLLWGGEAIADFIGTTKRKTQYLIDQGIIPVYRMGHRSIVARKSEIAHEFSSQRALSAARPAKPAPKTTTKLKKRAATGGR